MKVQVPVGVAIASGLRQERARPAVDISIIIVNWRSKNYVRKCLQSIEADDRPPSYEIFVVDNASGDGCGEMLHRDFPDVHYIDSQENLGFARANNLAFNRSSGRHILFLNPDTEVRGTALQTLSRMLDKLPHAGMVGARLLNSDGTLQTTCVTALPSILNQTLNFNVLRRAFPAWGIWGMRALLGSGSEPVGVEAISGACMMAHRHVVERVGGFSTGYFMYSEDMDLCVKVADTGKQIYYVPDAEIVHHAAGSSSQLEESHFSSLVLRESLIHYLETHRGPAYARAYRVVLALVCVGRLLLLALGLPVVLHPRGRTRLMATANKWMTILTWSLGLNKKRRGPFAKSQ